MAKSRGSGQTSAQGRLFKTRAAWRRWLEKNHDRADDIWLIFYKKHVGKKSLEYEEAVEEALCFGWIDSKLRRIDDEKHKQRYTPRRPGSNWAKSNKARVEKLIANGSMTEAGLLKINAAKQDGSWDRLDAVESVLIVPDDLRIALNRNRRAMKNFDAFTKSQKQQYLWWLETARRKETRKERVRQIVERATRGIKPGQQLPA
jgi:uncharacterized protein YdeI (YjbR/CyaY-like superfamily)